MSSATSTKTPASGTEPSEPAADQGLRPWQFFVLAALACATALTWLQRTQGPTAVILLTVVMGAIALAAMAMLRTVQPLVSADVDRTAMVGERTRAALEREKALTLRAIKELEFDRAMKRLSDDDFNEMSARLRARAGRLIRQLDAGSGYRERIEKDLAKRLGERPVVAHACTACATVNDPDARFCKGCGAKL
jgi:hypothetical protein